MKYVYKFLGIAAATLNNNRYINRTYQSQINKAANYVAVKSL